MHIIVENLCVKEPLAVMVAPLALMSSTVPPALTSILSQILEQQQRFERFIASSNMGAAPAPAAAQHQQQHQHQQLQQQHQQHRYQQQQQQQQP